MDKLLSLAKDPELDNEHSIDTSLMEVSFKVHNGSVTILRHTELTHEERRIMELEAEVERLTTILTEREGKKGEEVCDAPAEDECIPVSEVKTIEYVSSTDTVILPLSSTVPIVSESYYEDPFDILYNGGVTVVSKGDNNAIEVKTYVVGNRLFILYSDKRISIPLHPIVKLAGRVYGEVGKLDSLKKLTLIGESLLHNNVSNKDIFDRFLVWLYSVVICSMEYEESFQSRILSSAYIRYLNLRIRGDIYRYDGIRRTLFNIPMAINWIEYMYPYNEEEDDLYKEGLGSL